MARNMKLITGVCACCGAKQTINVAEYTKENNRELSLTEYFDFKFVNTNFCENCGYVNDNITKLIGPHTKSVVASDKYQIAVDDGYMDGYEDVPYQEYEDMAIGEFDALAMLYKAEKNTGLMYAKIQNRIAELKSVLRGEYYETMCDNYDDEEDREKYDAVVQHLTKQIEEADNECIKALKSVKLEYPYEVIFVAECLTRLYKYDKARELIAGVEANFTFDDELNDYIEEFLTEVERI
jgi:hypothetical protein